MARIITTIATTLLIFTCLLTNAQSSKSDEQAKTYNILFHQQAAEYRALCYQAFNTAKMQIDALPKKTLKKKNLVIITDIDETILDNSYSNAQLAKFNMEYSDAEWKKWSSMAKATAVPGASEFLKYAASKGISIFYISNRDTSELKATIKNLADLNLPNADTAHCLFMSSTSSKEARRQIISSEYNVLMLLGDNLNDFSKIFEKGSSAERARETDFQNYNWGKKFIVLPNVMYGEWMNAIYDYNKRLNSEQKEEIRLRQLKGTDL